MLTRKWMTFLTAFAVASAFAIPTYALPGAKAHRPKTTASKPPTVKGPKTTVPKSVASTKTMKGKAPTKATSAGAKASKTKSTTNPGLSKKTTTTSTDATTTTKKDSTSTSTPPDGGVWAPDNPVAQKLSTKPKLLNKVTNSLPPGTDLNAATAGFKNFGQFVAAVNVSNNLGIEFGDLKAAMTGTTLAGEPTGEGTLSLGQAIQTLKPGVDAVTEAQTAQTLANQEVIVDPSTTTATTGTSTRNSGKRGKSK